MNLYPYGIGKKEGTFVFTEDTVNPGQGRVGQQVTNSSATATPAATTTTSSVHIITLDDFAEERGWFESRPHIAVMKVDVEGLEHTVIDGARKLLKANLVRNIFMEISVRTPEESTSNKHLLEFLTSSAGYTLKKVGHWPGPGRTVTWPQDKQLVQNILDYAKEDPSKQLNLWWTMPSEADDAGSIVLGRRQ